MSRWIAITALACLMACNPSDGPGFGAGSNADDTGPGDTDSSTTSDCPPSFGDITAAIDAYPGKGWAVEVTAPFTEGTCSIADGELYIEHDDGSGGLATEGPFTIGFEDEEVYVEEYDAETGTGKLFYAFLVDSQGDQVTFSMWVRFGGGESSEHVEVTVSG
mgnify:CR=1 FL=1